MVHETLHKDIRGYIDDTVLFKGHIFVKGWAFHVNNGLSEIRCKFNNDIVKAEIIPKKGASDYYNNNKIILCGWKIKIPKSVQFCDIQMKIENEWYTFFTLKGLEKLKQEIVVISDNKNNVEKPKLGPGLTLRVVDNFYDDPEQEYIKSTSGHMTLNSGILVSETEYSHVDKIEKIIGKKINNVQCEIKCLTSQSFRQLLCNTNKYTAIISLTKECTHKSKVSTYKSVNLKNDIIYNDHERSIAFSNGENNFIFFDKMDSVYTKYNRIILFNPGVIYSFDEHFGNNINDSLLVQLVTFNIED